MSVTHTLHQNWVNGSRAIASSNNYTGNAQLTIDDTITHPQTDFPIAWTLDVSTIKLIFILSDKAITLETNTTGGVDTLVLVAGKPYIWHQGSYFTNVFATDITSLFVTNMSGDTAALKIEVVFDPTP